jgi:hypothetical protein
MVIGFISIFAMIAIFGIILVDFMKQINEKVGAENEQNEQNGQEWNNWQDRHKKQTRRNRQNNLVLLVPRSYQ